MPPSTSKLAMLGNAKVLYNGLMLGFNIKSLIDCNGNQLNAKVAIFDSGFYCVIDFLTCSLI